MIVNKYGNGGGGSASGVTPEQVQQQINSALTPYWESGITKEYVDSADTIIYASATSRMDDVEEVVSSALNEFHEQIMEVSAATAGKADAANVSGRSTGYYFPYYNAQGVITGDTQAYKETLTIHMSDGSTSSANLFKDNNYGIPGIYVASKPGTAGQIAKSDGHGFTWADDIYTPTSGFSTINGSAITNGGNIVIQGGGSSEEIELPIAAAVNKLKGDFEARLDQQYYKKQETNNLLKEKVTAGQVDVQIKNYTDPLFQAVYETIEEGDEIICLINK